MSEHYTVGRQWSYIHNAWILDSNWNDREEIARLKAKINMLEEKINMLNSEITLPIEKPDLSFLTIRKDI